ncbi:MAG: efflux RND transporter periplasmic adaptor subunit [Pseudomonadota bacterium]
MRFFPILSAILVCVALFFVVLQREQLFGFVYGVTGDEAPERDETQQITEPVAIADEEDASDEVVQVVVLRSRAGEVPDAVMVRGQSEAAREVIVRSETTGVVVSEPIRKGAFVEAGERLCELDPGSRAASLGEAQSRLLEAQARVPEAESRLIEAEARLQEAQINQTAAARLSDSGFASTTQLANADAALRSAEAAVTAAEVGLDSTQAGIEAAQAAVEQAQIEIDNLTIEAPFAGLLETDTAELGSLLQPGTDCATIVQLDPMRLVGFLPEAQVDRVDVGAMAAARLASGAEATGEVTFLSRSADDLTRTFRVEVTVTNEDLRIRDGQTAEILIETPATLAHLIPASALTLNDDGALGVRIVEDGVAGFAPVELIRDTVDGVLLGGLPDSVEIITVGQEYVTDGVPVRASYVEASAAEVSQ